VDDNFTALARTFDLDEASLQRLARNSITASFLDKPRKDELLARFDAAALGTPT